MTVTLMVTLARGGGVVPRWHIFSFRAASPVMLLLRYTCVSRIANTPMAYLTPRAPLGHLAQ